MSEYIYAHSKIADALDVHYATGDYVKLGMRLQDYEREIQAALKLADAFAQAQDLMAAMRT